MFSLKKSDYEVSTAVMFAAYDALITYESNYLPIDPLSILQKKENVSIYNYDEFPRLIDISSESLRSEFGDGILIYSKEEEKYCILYDPSLSGNDFRWFLSYCIAAARLQMDEYMVEAGSGYSNFEESNSINDFAYFFTSPDPVLRECNIFKTEEILKYCQIPFKFAHQKHKRLRQTRKHNIKYAIEDLLVKNFDKFIHNFKA